MEEDEKKILVTYAVDQERIEILWDDMEFLYLKTGIGKVKSAHYLTQVIESFKPDAVLNIGTAGSVNHKVGDVICCTQFIDRDLRSVADALRLGCTQDTTLTLLEKNVAMSWPKGGVCNTGDSFVTNNLDVEGDVVDMEAYAQAFVCEQLDIPFISVKCVTDIIGENSVADWESKLAMAQSKLQIYLNEKLKSIL